jgi:hypothetical protein
MKSNKLIAEFMGVKSYEASGYTNYVYSEDNHRPEVDLAYHEDWKRWLKPVVEKIDDYLFENVGKVGYFDECLSSNELDVTYQAVVDFIIWYNSNKLNCEECNDQGWIDTYNTSSNIQEIQRCDECKVFVSDKEAKEFINQLKTK